MLRFYTDKIKFKNLLQCPLKWLNVFICGIIIMVALSSCGRVYFPIELRTISRTDRSAKQENSEVKIIPMTTVSIKDSNSHPYKRRIIEAGDLSEPASLVSINDALIEKFPIKNDPGPYLLGIGDVLTVSEMSTNSSGSRYILSRDIVINEEGSINLIGLGRINARGLTLSQLEDYIFKKYLDSGRSIDLIVAIKSFNSKKIFISVDGLPTKTIPYVANPMYLELVVANIGLKLMPGSDSKVIVLRDNSEFVFSARKLLQSVNARFRVFPEDKILLKPLNYRSETVLVVGETGAQRSIPINSFQRPTLSDTIFSGPILNNLTSDFSQIYVLRKKKSLFHAYHLDITNPTRVSLASKFEMRPDDIVFVATQPLSLYSRTLSQILGSTGLTLQARDTIRTEIGN